MIDYAENIIERNLALVSYALKFSFNQEDILCKESILFSSPGLRAWPSR